MTTATLAVAAEGVVPALPIVRWLRARGGPIGRFHQAVLLRLPEPPDAAALAIALERLAVRHPALRLRWRGEVLEVPPLAEAVPAAACIRRAVLTDDGGGALAALAGQAAGRLDPAAGRMLDAVLIADGGAGGRLLLTIHHLAVDGVSWRILLPDLQAAYAAVRRGEEAEEGAAAGSSLRGWARALAAAGRDGRFRDELAFWRAVGAGVACRPPVLDATRDVAGSAGHLRRVLEPAVSAVLVTAVPAAVRGEINDVLLAGLTLALAGWRGRGQGPVLVELEGHGREVAAVEGGLDLSATVGWFTSLYPLRLDAGVADGDLVLADPPALGAVLKRIKEQLRQVPNKGLGYGVLRWLDPVAAGQLADGPAAELGFNYLGRFGGEEEDGWRLEPLPATVGGGMDPAMPLAQPLSVDAVMRQTPAGLQLEADWRWAPRLLEAAQVGALAERWFAALRALAAAVGMPGFGGLTPSDLPLVRLGQEEIAALEAARPGLEAVWPLTPLQDGLLFHALLEQDGGAEDPYTVQLALDLAGELAPERLRAALAALLARHASLRACFVAPAEGGAALQLVMAAPALPWRVVDGQDREPAAQAGWLEEVAQAERAQRFDPAQPPPSCGRRCCALLRAAGGCC